MSAPSRPPSFAVVVLAWNHLDVTLACLASLAQLDYPSDRLLLYLVDNGSTDGTAAVVRTRFPNARIIETGANLGYSGGNNVALACALQTGADYILLLNNDTVVDPQLLQRLAEAAGSNDAIGIVAPTAYYFDDPSRIWCAGAELDERNLKSRRLQADENDGAHDAELAAIGYAPGCAFCVRREAVEELGGFDPRFFLYYEETDWCERARRAGWQVVLARRARVWHHVAASIGANSPATDYYMLRNSLLFAAKHRRGWRRLRLLATIVSENLLTIGAYTMKPAGGQRRRHRNARTLALRDATLGRWGEMGRDVAQVCEAPR